MFIHDESAGPASADIDSEERVMSSTNTDCNPEDQCSRLAEAVDPSHAAVGGASHACLNPLQRLLLHLLRGGIAWPNLPKFDRNRSRSYMSESSGVNQISGAPALIKEGGRHGRQGKVTVFCRKGPLAKFIYYAGFFSSGARVADSIGTCVRA